MRAVFNRELKAYFCNMTGYVFGAFLLLFAGIYMMVINLKSLYPNFEYVLSNMSFIFLVAIPVLTMRSIAEDKKQKTDQLLYSLPLNMTKIVAGKYFSMLAVLAVPVVIMGVYPVILSMYGTVTLRIAYGALLGFFFLGAALISMGMFASSLTESQIVSAVLCFIFVLVNYFISDLANYISGTSTASFMAFSVIVLVAAIAIGWLTKNMYAAIIFAVILEGVLLGILLLSPSTLEGLFPEIMSKISLFDRFDTFVDGVFDITALVYYSMVSLVFGFLTVQSLEKRRWS